MEELAQYLLWSGVIGYFVMLPLLVYRTVIVRKIPEPIVPHIAIFAAPVNLCVVGAITVYASPPELLIYVLTVFGVISYIAVMLYMPVMLNRKFYPTFAALTFPLVISAASFHSLGGYYGISTDGLFGILLLITAIIAIAIVVYVFIRFLIFLYQAVRSAPS
jgi:exfoliative toxin A/B